MHVGVKFSFSFLLQHTYSVTCIDDMNPFNHKTILKKVAKPNSAYTCSITRNLRRKMINLNVYHNIPIQLLAIKFNKSAM